MIKVLDKAYDRYDFAKYSFEKYSNKKINYKVFDIGSLDGRLKKYLNYTNIEYYAFDKNRLILDIEIHEWDLESKINPQYGKCNFAFLLDVLEHLYNPKICLENIKDSLNSNGYLIITVPNPSYSIGRIKFLLKGNLPKFSKLDLDTNHHVFVTFNHIVLKLLDEIGFEILEYVLITKVPKFMNQNESTIKNMIKKIINYSFKNKMNKGYSYGLICRKKE